MRFQLLGPLSITDGRDVVVLPPAKPTSLLAALLVRPGEVVPTDRLRQAVWGEEQPATAKAALQSCVLRLRRLFAKYDIEEQAVVAVAGGYRVPADGDTLDLLHFRRLVSDAAGAGENELPLLRTALGLWRGPLLTNVPSETLHRDEVPRLVEERLRALERLCEIQLTRGRCREVLVDLWEATRTHPHHEGLAAQLMRALYRVGRQTEALAEYRRVREHLRDELGVDPGAELQSLELAILRGDEPRGPVAGTARLTTGAVGGAGAAGAGGGRPAPSSGAVVDGPGGAAPVPPERGGAPSGGPVPPRSSAPEGMRPVPVGAPTAEPWPGTGPGTRPFAASPGGAPGDAVGPRAPGASHAGTSDAGAPPTSAAGTDGAGTDGAGTGGAGTDGAGTGGPASVGAGPVGAGPGASGAGASIPGAAGGPGARLPRVPGFTGRARETAALVAHLAGGGRGEADRPGSAPPVAVVSGGPGMGKTALALHAARLVADRFPGGGLLLPLTRADGTPRRADEAAGELLSALPSGTARGRCLVILDDVVHPDQVRGLLDLAGCGAFVVTSRMGLAALVATHGPAVVQLGALPPQESYALLTAVLGTERVAAEPEAVRALAGMCGHVPLALRIVAARLLTRPRLGLADHAAWLGRDLPGRLALPDDPRMSVPQALDGALARLPAPLAGAHLRLARLGGPITAPAAAAALALPETHAEELLERLLDTGLLDEERPGVLRMNPLYRAHALCGTARSGGPPRTDGGVATASSRHALPSGAV
ncbi:BTAD domain-containing putative transcriptional regulator [Streptomyces fradiae]|uniref:BTAD domain-containing putative transcriptional regulator n=1 Tax=Streptomyces fradiae TaxID=1906 RepID=UPI002942A8F5|nr:BTAD domain-containing putative transcriptional regulator [Streptomyces fradiae]WOI61896.1 BTAD domain-containing putative transcriptional regulator [Streptomyces fradiae]